jgi:hypothetical protein
VVATYLESLEPLRDVMMLDDWRTGLDTYLFEPHTVRDHLARAQPILAQHFSIDAIGRQWNEVLGGGRAELSRPAPIGSRPSRWPERLLKAKIKANGEESPEKAGPPAFDDHLAAGRSAAAAHHRDRGVCIASIFELVGFAAIIPLLSVMSPETDMELGGRREMIHNALESAFTAVGLPMRCCRRCCSPSSFSW